MKTMQITRNLVITLSTAAALALAALGLTACNDGGKYLPPPPPPVHTELGDGFFLLNEGTMGAGNATLDFYDFESNTLIRNIFEARNPNVTMGLGDTATDLAMHDGLLWVAVHGSDYVEVIDAATALHVAAIPIPKPRYIAFSGGFAYITSYDRATLADGRWFGKVYKIDTRTLEIEATCVVGHQPEEIAVIDGNLFVANSGGYNAPEYDNAVTMITAFTQSVTATVSIPVAPNLWHVRADATGSKLIVSSRGDYGDTPPAIFIVDPVGQRVTGSLPIVANAIAAGPDNMFYVVGTSYTEDFSDSTNTYTSFDATNGSVAEGSFITDGTENQIISPYGLAVEPVRSGSESGSGSAAGGRIFVTDAGDYFSDGRLHCYSAEGRLLWSVTTGVVPSKIQLKIED